MGMGMMMIESRDDDDGESDDSDRKFVRRMSPFGTPKDPSNDKNKAKEADTIKVPAFPHAESYRNWRIRTREAVMSASTDPDKAFDWISETWKEGQTWKTPEMWGNSPHWTPSCCQHSPTP